MPSTQVSIRVSVKRSLNDPMVARISTDPDVAREDNHLILGLQAVGAGMAELAAAFSALIEMGARLEDVAETIHAHPKT